VGQGGQRWHRISYVVTAAVMDLHGLTCIQHTHTMTSAGEAMQVHHCCSHKVGSITCGMAWSTLMGVSICSAV
jgi:hypothetical protein